MSEHCKQVNVYHSLFSGEIVKDLKSCDAGVQQKAMEKADCYIESLDKPCRTEVNKTRINTNPPLRPSSVKTCTHTSQPTKYSPSVALHLSQSSCFCVSNTTHLLCCLSCPFFVNRYNRTKRFTASTHKGGFC